MLLQKFHAVISSCAHTGEFTWDESQLKSTLTNINFEAKRGSLTMVVGSVGECYTLEHALLSLVRICWGATVL